MRVPDLMRCFGAAPPNVYTRSECCGVHESVAEPAATDFSSGADRLAATACASAGAVDDASGPLFEQAMAAPANPSGKCVRNRRLFSMVPTILRQLSRREAFAMDRLSSRAQRTRAHQR